MKLTTFNDISDSIGKYYTEKGGDKGKSTGWPAVDELFTQGTGQLVVVTGIPSSGKSEWLDELSLINAAIHNQHTTYFSPENWPLEAHFQKLAEKFIGKPMFRRGHIEGMTPMEIKEAREFLSHHTTFLEPTDKELNIDALLAGLAECDKLCATNNFILDPWNELEHNHSKTVSETNHVSECLSKIRNFGRLHKINMIIVAHPTKLQKDQDGNYPVPTPYDIAGSAHWRNKADVCISLWRDYGLNDGVVQVHIQKMRNKNYGHLGSTELHWLWTNGLFLDKPDDINNGERYGIKHRVI